MINNYIFACLLPQACLLQLPAVRHIVLWYRYPNIYVLFNLKYI